MSASLLLSVTHTLYCVLYHLLLQSIMCRQKTLYKNQIALYYTERWRSVAANVYKSLIHNGSQFLTITSLITVCYFLKCICLSICMTSWGALPLPVKYKACHFLRHALNFLPNLSQWLCQTMQRSFSALQMFWPGKYPNQTSYLT